MTSPLLGMKVAVENICKLGSLKEQSLKRIMGP